MHISFVLRIELSCAGGIELPPPPPPTRISRTQVVILEEKLDWRRLARGTHEVGADDGKDSSDPDLGNGIKRRRDFSKISDGDPHEDLSNNNTGVPGDPLGDWVVREEFGRRLPPPGDAEDGESDMNRDWGVGGGGGGGSEGGDEVEGGGLPEGVQLDVRSWLSWGLFVPSFVLVFVASLC